MKKVLFVISNPNHHVQLTLPVIQELKKRKDYQVDLLSLCEIRRMKTPVEPFDQAGATVHQAVKWNTSDHISPNSGVKTLGAKLNWKRRIVQKTIWHSVVRPTFSELANRSDTVVMCNDSAAPHEFMAQFMVRRDKRFCLIQEGIRFHQPGDKFPRYGTFGANHIFAWGDNSKKYFENCAQNRSEVLSIGCPRYDSILNADYTEKLQDIQSRWPEAMINIGLFTNPVNDIGFCTYEEKLQLVAQVVQQMLEVVRPSQIRIYLKPHPRESLEDYQRVLKDFNVVRFIPANVDIFALLKLVDRSIVLASTVGLESLLFGKPVAVVRIGGNEFGHDYVQSGAATGLDLQRGFNEQLTDFLQQTEISAAAREYLNYNLSNIGTSAQKIAAFIRQVND